MAHTKLYIPGPIEVSAKTFAAMTQPMIGHRSKDFQALYGRIMPMLQQVFGTTQPVFISTSSAWGVMEGSIRNLVAKKVLNCCCGAFSDKWYDVSLACGKQAEALKVEWGQPITPEAVDAALSKGGFDAVTLVHSETSTGVLNPLKEIAEVVKKYPDVLLITDTVSSFSTVPIGFDELGLDVMLLGSQKALPGVCGSAVGREGAAGDIQRSVRRRDAAGLLQDGASLLALRRGNGEQPAKQRGSGVRRAGGKHGRAIALLPHRTGASGGSRRGFPG